MTRAKDISKILTDADISGNIDVDGVTNLDVVDIDGAVDMASTLVIGSAGGNWNGANNGRNLTIHGASATTTGVGQISIQSTDSFGADLGGGISFGGEYSAGDNIDWATLFGRKENGTDDNTAGYMQFNTRVNSGNMTERMRIDSSGNVGIGETSPLGKLHVKTADSGASAIVHGDELVVEGSGNSGMSILSGNSSSGTIYFGDSDDNNVGEIQYSHSNNHLAFNVNASERVRIDSIGSLLVSCTALPSASTIGSALLGDVNQGRLYLACNNTGARDLAYFFNPNGLVGRITTSGSATAFTTSSDYRLKENVVTEWDATTRLKQLKPSRFNFIADADTTVDGFLAHETQAVVAEAVHGTKDELEVWAEGEELPDGVSVGDNKLDDDGKTIPKMQGIDQAKLVPLLTAALQEAIAKIETLETQNTTQATQIADLITRVTALEAE